MPRLATEQGQTVAIDSPADQALKLMLAQSLIRCLRRSTPDRYRQDCR